MPYATVRMFSATSHIMIGLGRCASAWTTSWKVSVYGTCNARRNAEELEMRTHAGALSVDGQLHYSSPEKLKAVEQTPVQVAG